MEIRFKDKDHELNYDSILELMKKDDCYHRSLAYVFALDTVCFTNLRRLFDFADDKIKPQSLDEAWQTGTSKKSTRLAFNLWNGYCTDGETYIGSDGFEEMLPSRFYTPYTFFNCEDAPYYVEALKIRFPKFWKI